MRSMSMVRISRMKKKLGGLVDLTPDGHLNLLRSDSENHPGAIEATEMRIR